MCNSSSCIAMQGTLADLGDCPSGGYATEALIGAVRHTLAGGARHVKADTDLQNFDSQNVLAKAGFREISRSDKLIYFRFP